MNDTQVVCPNCGQIKGWPGACLACAPGSWTRLKETLRAGRLGLPDAASIFELSGKEVSDGRTR